MLREVLNNVDSSQSKRSSRGGFPMRDSEFNVESEAAILIDRVKRV